MSGIKQLIVLALALPTAQAFCCFWSSTNDACECDAVASDGSWCAASEDQCLQCGDAQWCDDEPEEPEDTCKGDYSACQGCGGEQCTYCSAEQDVNCCVAEGGDLYECCEASAPFSWRYSMNECDSVAHKTPEPTPAEPSCKGDYTACQGCGGEQCTYCSAEQDVNCCVAEGGDLYECCEASAPFSWRYSMNECDSVAHKTPEPTPAEPSCKGDYSACQGCGGEQCTYCSAEQDVNCCVAEGGDLYECCEASAPFSWRYSMNECDSVAHKTPEPTPAEPSCKGDYSACQGCSGEQCTYCAAMEDIKCCPQSERRLPPPPATPNS
ncbi:N,N-dimethylaniline monooxygenase [Aureococcus anophagefferens]|nr:N,N-dimethylaniline monooxygenase [Aureococcus anophagefferens]